MAPSIVWCCGMLCCVALFCVVYYVASCRSVPGCVGLSCCVLCDVFCVMIWCDSCWAIVIRRVGSYVFYVGGACVCHCMFASVGGFVVVVSCCFDVLYCHILSCRRVVCVVCVFVMLCCPVLSCLV